MSEQDPYTRLETRLFGLDGTGGALGELRDDVHAIQTEVSEWRGVKNFVKAGASLLGIGGLAAIAAALASMGR